MSQFIWGEWGIEMIRIAVCDDEDYYKNKIKNKLHDYFLAKDILYKIDAYHSGVQMLEIRERIKDYDIVFLDINMQELDGIETAWEIRKYSNDIFIVFVTAHISYSPEGYRVGAIRYILKNHENFDIAFAECLEEIQLRMNDKEMWQLFEFQEGKVKVKLNSIMYIESNLHKLNFYIMNEGVSKKYTMYGKLDAIEEKLLLNTFCRIHKSFLVNLKYVVDLQRYQIVLLYGQELSVAKQRYPDVKSKYISSKGVI